MKIENCNHLKTLFADPPREYSAAPFWFLNDDMKPEELRLQLQKMQHKAAILNVHSVVKTRDMPAE